MNEPWQHMAHTYEWVIEQEFISTSHTRKTEEWVVEQRIYRAKDNGYRNLCNRRVTQGRGWEDIAYTYEVEAKQWIQQEEAKRRAKERERAQIVQEEVRRIEARIRYRREVEENRRQEERAKIKAELRRRDMAAKAKLDKATVKAWEDYQ